MTNLWWCLGAKAGAQHYLIDFTTRLHWIPAFERVKKSKSLTFVKAGHQPGHAGVIEMLQFFFVDGRVKHGHDKGQDCNPP
jgi:hypothetical protein